MHNDSLARAMSKKFKSCSTSFPHLSQESLSQATHCIYQMYLPVVASKYWLNIRHIMCTW